MSRHSDLYPVFLHVECEMTTSEFLEYSSSSRMVSVPLCRAHSRAVVFQILHRGQKDTRLYTYLISYATLYLLPLPHLRQSSVLTPSFTLTTHTCLILMPLLPSTLPPISQFPPVTTTTYSPIPPCFLSVAP